MVIEVLGKNGLEITPAIREYAQKKLTKLEKYYHLKEELRATVLCKVYPTHHKVEVTIPGKNFTLRSETTDKDLYAAIDLSVDKLERQMRKFKEKLTTLTQEGHTDKFLDPEEYKSKDIFKEVFRSKKLPLVPLSLDEAMEQMEMIDHDFFAYLDNLTMKVSILYVRKDGEVARLETEY